ncbi:MAG: quinone-dependent dihydroorotate dehydrogenase, partial [Alphaproteobacteria bacterium]
FVEIGTVTPRAQPGNPRPRLFRLVEDAAIINRLGFNNRGAEAAARSLVRFRAGAQKGIFVGPRHVDAIIGVNIGRNRDSTDAAADYEAAARALAGVASYLVINVSSPNTPGLRALQGRDELTALVAAVRAAVPKKPPPLLVKIAPDLDTRDMKDIAHVARGKGVDGLIVSNTTVARPADLTSRHRAEPGGLSGKPLMGPSTDLLAEMYRLTRGQVPLVGVGGIAGGDDAYAKIRAGASLVQLYTALVFEGPDLIARIKADLAAHLKKDGFATIAEAVGADHR